MKRLILILAAVVLSAIAASAQDVVTKENGEDMNTVCCESGVCSDIQPGMKYKELKKLYDYSDWNSGCDNRYNPAMMGVCSWLIPGLGQMITGEVGRGFAWLGGAVGCTVLMGIGSGVSASAYYYDVDENYYVDTSKVLTGSLIVLASSLALLTVDICAIVDACRMAKVKNLYEQDLKAKKYSFELHPAVDYITMPGGIQPTAGLTLAMKF